MSDHNAFLQANIDRKFFCCFFVNKTLNMQFEETNNSHDNYDNVSRHTRSTQ